MAEQSAHATQAAVVLDIGGDVGALVLYTGAEDDAAEIDISIAPPNAWTIRPPISHNAPALPSNGSSDNAMEAIVNTTKPRL